MPGASNGVAGSARTLGPVEAELVAWLEVERPATIDVDDVCKTFDWPRRRVYGLLSRLAKKGWLQRTVAGRYGPLQPALLGQARQEAVHPSPGPVKGLADVIYVDRRRPLDLQPGDKLRLDGSKRPG